MNNLDHWNERVDLAAAFRWTARLNMHEGVANHFSLAINDDGTRFLMNPNQMHFSRIKASDLIVVDANGHGEMAFGALEASLDCGFTPNGINFEWNGADEGDQVCGEGWADLRDNGYLEGGISYRNGDESSFIAAPWMTFSTTCQALPSSQLATQIGQEK